MPGMPHQPPMTCCSECSEWYHAGMYAFLQFLLKRLRQRMYAGVVKVVLKLVSV